MKSARLCLIAAIGLTAACGRVTELRPPRGQSLPVKPLLAKVTPTAEDLLSPPTYARPERIDELMRRSEPRQPDRFDLPPPDGGLAPLLPETELSPETDGQSSSEQKGPVDPL